MKLVVACGDSITYGQHLTDPDSAWPRLITGRLVVSAGMPGDTTRLGLERFPKLVQESGADAVIIQFGHNDANRWLTDQGLPRVSIKAFEANLDEMIERAWNFDIRPLLCSLTPTRRSDEHAVDCERYDDVIREVCDATRTTLIDVRRAFDDEPAYLMADGLHLSEMGHIVYAETVQRVLDEEGIA